MSLEKKQIAELVQFANQLVCDQRGEPLDYFDQKILEQALQGVKLSHIRVDRMKPTTIKTCRAPALWKTLSSVTRQKVGMRNVQQVLKATYADHQQRQVSVTQPDYPAPAEEQPAFDNLPAPTCNRFVGRVAELERLMELLSPDHSAHLITISGIGGMGKTSLAVECARRCRDVRRKSSRSGSIPQFDVFMFVSAKLSHLKFEGLLPCPDPARSLSDLLQQLADCLNLDLTGLQLREQMRRLKLAFLQRRTLLIVDNLETIDNQNEVIGFLYDLPPSVKVMLTTREQWGYEPLRLTALPEQDALNLIEHEVKARNLPLTKTKYQTLYQVTHGVPLALNYVMGQLQNGFKLETVSRGIGQPTHQVAQYCFEATVQPLRGTTAHRILMALVLLPAPVAKPALIAIATPEDEGSAATVLNDLWRLMLIDQTNDCYSMQSVTREYMLAESQTDPAFIAAAKERWINWYLDFSQPYADRDATLWQTRFEDLSQQWTNLQTVAQWLMEANQYETMFRFWRNLEAYTYAKGRERLRSRYWAIRLDWTAWLIQACTERGDLKEATQVMLDRAWTLVTTRKAQLLPEAEALFQQIWDWRHYQPKSFHLDMALKRAVMYVEKNDFTTAEAWFKTTETLINQIDLDELKRTYQVMELRYYRGMCEFKNQQMAAAKQHFEFVREMAQTLQNDRMLRMAENFLADIAVLDGNFLTAEQMLDEGLRVSKNNQDWIQVAFTYRSLAKLYGEKAKRFPDHRQEDLELAQEFGAKAVRQFTSLEMMNQAEDTQGWMDKLVAELAGQNKSR